MPRKKKNNNNKSKETKVEPVKEEDEEEVEVKTHDIRFECPFCKNMLEMQNELIIKKKGECQCKCVPFSFKLSTNDKSLTIDKSKDGDINVETDIHNIQFKWGRGITPTEEDTTLETIRCIADN